MMRSLLTFLILLSLLSSATLYSGQIVDLSGAWDFGIDPQEVGIAESWFDGSAPLPNRINVPGAWNAQGIGDQSERLFSDYPGPAWYRRTVDIPADWAGRIVWLKFGGVHRYAEVWVNGKRVGEHIGYPAPFKFDVTEFVTPGRQAVIAVRVDARQRKDVDPLVGCFDIIDAVHITWGGLYRGVELEATEADRIEDVFVVPRIADRAAEVRVTLGRSDSSGPLSVIVRIRDKDGQIAGSGEAKLDAGQTSATVPTQIFGLKLWSPKDPYLYSATVTLTDGTRDLDSRTVPSGSGCVRSR